MNKKITTGKYVHWAGDVPRQQQKLWPKSNINSISIDSSSSNKRHLKISDIEGEENWVDKIAQRRARATCGSYR